MAKVGKDIPQSCFPVDEPRWETFRKSSLWCEVEKQLSFKYQWSSLEDLEMVDTEVVTKKGFNVYLVSGDDSVDVSIEGYE